MTLSTISNYLFVFMGAAFGGVFRYWLSDIAQKHFPPYFPYGTLTVNVVGSFFLGVIIFYFDQRALISPPMKLFLTIGFCGGFTTFSTFSYETLALFNTAQFFLAFTNIFLNVIFSLAGITIAYWLFKI
ncbi:MAG TPA: fluoride efflux transporter CrcB [Bacteroidetes bacterium]|nr:fluoride efflux transporter CrcB [Bacteroidota bacterium]HRI46667.1 fluoride efflux transporter CrcB [Ignavibacteriaceae bacterium]